MIIITANIARLRCVECGHHENLVRCYCGWSIDGEDGRSELDELGEVVDDVY